MREASFSVPDNRARMKAKDIIPGEFTPMPEENDNRSPVALEQRG